MYPGYYAKMFPEIPQKSKSGFLRVLWENDPFKAKWALLAKAYSSVRDDNPGQVSLDTYMSICDQFIGVIAPEHYLAAMNWNVGGSGSGEMSLQRGNVANAGFDMSLLTTDKSASDIVNHCYEVGYVKATGDLGDGSATAQSIVPALAFAVQPAPAETPTSKCNLKTIQTTFATSNFIPAQLYSDHEQMTATSALAAATPGKQAQRPNLVYLDSNMRTAVTTIGQSNDDTSGQLNDDEFMDESGQFMDESGQFMDESGQLMDESGQPIGFGGLFGDDEDVVDYPTIDWNNGAFADNPEQVLDGSDELLKTSLEEFLSQFESEMKSESEELDSNELALHGEESDGNELSHLSPHDQLALENERIALDEADYRDLFLPGGDSLLPYDPYTAQDLFDPFDITATL
jgi:hypothetical protein